MKNFFTLYRNTLLACAFATVLFCIFQFFPDLSHMVGWGLMWTVGRILPPLSMVFLVAGPWIVAVAVCIAIAIIYWLMGVRSFILASAFGFSASYFLISLSTSLIGSSWPDYAIVMGSILTYLLFLGTYWLISRVRISQKIAVPTGAALVVAALCLTPLVTAPIDAERSQNKKESSFQQGIKKINFTPYYPTYSSAVLPTSPPRLEDYSSDDYQNETVTFKLGSAEIIQSKILDGQEKVIDFSKNCDILTVKSSMTWGTSVKQGDIEQSLENPKRCNLVQTTPSGKKVYSMSIDKTIRWFYVQLEQTNFIVDFDDTSDKKFDPSKQNELLKIIDSLQPLDKQKLEDGENSY